MPAAKPRIAKICLLCGASFSVWPSIDKRGDGSYCGRACHAFAFAHGNKAFGNKNHMWKGGIKHSGHGYLHQKTDHHPRAQDGYVPQHILIAEKALGKHLPAGAPVHHADLNRANNANNNLVICQDAAYHNLLHKRRRVLLAGGNPNLDKICAKCRGCLSHANFSRDRSSSDGLNNVCRKCNACIQKSYREKKAK